MKAHTPMTVCLASWTGLFCAAALARAAESPFVAFMENSSTLTVIQDGQTYLDVTLVGWGPNWSWMGFDGELTSQTGQARFRNTSKSREGGPTITVTGSAEQAGPGQLKLQYQVQTTADTELTYIVAALEPAAAPFRQGTVTVGSEGGPPAVAPLPLDKRGIGTAVREFTLSDAGRRPTRVRLEPARDVPSDGAARIVLAAAKFRQHEPAAVTLTIDLPGTVNFYAAGDQIPNEAGFEKWFEFSPDDRHDAPSEIGMQNWLESPAGKHGRIAQVADKLVYHNKPIKLWGVNVCYESCAPEKELARQRAAFYAKYGVNAVRLHKYADGAGWSGIQSEDSFVQFDPAGLDRMDYFIAQLKERGIYVKLSAHFGSQKLGPADKQVVPYLEEFGQFDGNRARIETPHSAVHYSPELQDLQIRQMVNLLQHKNPYTGQTYADEPAVAFLEIINEQSILFYSSLAPLKASPTLRKYVAGRFCDWLRAKYRNHEQLETSWGGKPALDSFTGEGFPAVGEHLDRNNILPLGNPWFWDPEQLAGSQAFRRQRLLDTLEFLYGLQNEFYQRYVQAMRGAGYQGAIVASNWQAGRALSHCYNLHSDALVGTVDRHNYFGGGSGGRIDNATMLSVPGSGILSSGMQQVADRPFMLSEWIHVTPNEWGVEGPAVIGAYGLGLQGWDVSFLFQNRDTGNFSERIGRDRWDATAPQVMGVFPAVARQVLRGDVLESDTVAPCYVHVPSLSAGKLGFRDEVQQQYDVKAFGTDKVPAATLAVARCAVDFTDSYRDTPQFEVSRYLRDGGYTSSTGQLRWKPGAARLDGFFTLDTAGTKGVVGFARGQTCDLGEVTIRPQCRYAAIYVTAQEPDRDLGSSRNLIVVALARARNRGMKVFNDDRIIAPGTGPVVLEPVQALIRIAKTGNPTVFLLDHNGRKTERTLEVRNGEFLIDGARDQTCYYLVSYAQP